MLKELVLTTALTLLNTGVYGQINSRQEQLVKEEKIVEWMINTTTEQEGSTYVKQIKMFNFSNRQVKTAKIIYFDNDQDKKYSSNDVFVMCVRDELFGDITTAKNYTYYSSPDYKNPHITSDFKPEETLLEQTNRDLDSIITKQIPKKS